jgi:hypothetical protein
MKATANSDRVSLNHKDLHHKYVLQVEHRLPLRKLARSQFTINSITLFPRNATLHENDP